MSYASDALLRDTVAKVRELERKIAELEAILAKRESPPAIRSTVSLRKQPAQL